MKVIVTTPCLDLPGGVANYYSILRQYLPESLEYFTVGRRAMKPGGLLTLCGRLFRDYLFFAMKLLSFKYDALVVNPSLSFQALWRDGLFLVMARVCKLKTVVFFRGWSTEVETKLRGWRGAIFKCIFLRSNMIIVLANAFEDKLREMGYQNRLLVETTAVEDFVFAEGNDKEIKKKGKNLKPIVLFLSRLERRKGIFEVLAAFKEIVPEFPNAKLLVAGNGPEYQDAVDFVSRNNMNSVQFLGHVTGDDKKNAFLSSEIFVFPSQYGEGMPAALLEALAYGLPVITCPIAGIRDIIEEGKMGLLIENNDPANIVNAMRKILSSSFPYRQIADYNREYAYRHFRASLVAGRIFQSLLELKSPS